MHELPYKAGASFHERLLALRLRKAAEMLTQADPRRVSDVVFACGFNDLSYFNRCFRRHFGLTPTAARGHQSQQRALRRPDALALGRDGPHVARMISNASHSGTARHYRPTPNDGPVIDQDGRIVEPSGAGQGSFGFEGFEFRTSSANPFGELTREQRIARLEVLAKLLDVAFVVPGTKIRYGIDGLIGLIPVVGDIITTAISLWLVREARALGAPWHVTARMLGNVAVDGVVGLVPLAGDAFDVMFRANIRNMRLLRRWMEKQPR